MIDQITLLLATPIAKAVLDKFYEGIGSKLGEKAVEKLPEKVRHLGQVIWEKCLRGEPGTDELIHNAANGSSEDQEKLKLYVHRVLESDSLLNQEIQKLAEEIHQVVQFDNVVAENVQQNFGGQNLQVNNPNQPVIQVQGSPSFHFGTNLKHD